MLYWAIISSFVLIPIIHQRLIKRKSWKEVRQIILPSYQGHKKEIIGALTLFSALFLGFMLINFGLTAFDIATGTGVNDLEQVQQVVSEEIAQGLWYFILTLIIVVFVEELFFRAYLVPRIGMIPSTLIFTVAHTGYGSVAELIGVFFLGLLISYWFKRNHSIYQTYFGHLLYNFVALLFYFI